MGRKEKGRKMTEKERAQPCEKYNIQFKMQIKHNNQKN